MKTDQPLCHQNQHIIKSYNTSLIQQANASHVQSVLHTCFASKHYKLRTSHQNFQNRLKMTELLTQEVQSSTQKQRKTWDSFVRR